MPRQIDKDTLATIAGEHVRTGSRDLLDSTLRTLESRSKRKAMEQEGELRSLEIQRATQEQLEYMQAANTRSVQAQIANKRAEAALENAENMLEQEQFALEAQHMQTQVEALHSSIDMLIAQPDHTSFTNAYDRVKETMPTEIAEAFNPDKVNWNDPAQRQAAQESMLRDREFLQRLMLQQAAASGQGGGSIKKATGHMPTTLMALSAANIDAEYAPQVGQLVEDVANEYREDYGQTVDVSQTQSAAIELLQRNPEKYTVSEGFLGKDDRVRTDLLRRDIQSVVEVGVPYELWTKVIEANKKLQLIKPSQQKPLEPEQLIEYTKTQIREGWLAGQI